MKRPISGFGKDDAGDWFAVLSCGHRQHVRHQPPFRNQPWTQTEAGRHGMLGETLNCVRCERFELPDEFICYKQTPVFSEQTVPLGLLKDHSTKAGVWGKIVVNKGRLRYCVAALDRAFELSVPQPGIIVPEVMHHLELTEAVHFYVGFYRSPPA
jgi:tellurite resistance-related uncharacterized protein